MKVYVVVENLIDCDIVIAVFSTKEKAEEFKEKFLTNCIFADITIEEWDVDGDTIGVQI